MVDLWVCGGRDVEWCVFEGACCVVRGKIQNMELYEWDLLK